MSDRYGSMHKFSEQSDRTLELSLHRIEWKHWSSVSTFILYAFCVFLIYIFSRFYILTDRLDSYVNCTDTEVVDIRYCWERENATIIAQDISHRTFHSGNRVEGKPVIIDEETGQHIDQSTQKRPESQHELKINPIHFHNTHYWSYI